MLDEVPDDQLEFDIKGGFLDASAPDLAYGFGLSNSDVRYEVTQSGLSISGAGKYGPAPVVFDWKETFPKPGADNASASELTASAKVTPDLLNAFGVAARNIMQGEASMQLHALGSGRDFTSITADLDLTRASLDISELGWRKKFDAAATGAMRYGKDVRTGNAVMTGDIRADGLELAGEMRLDPKSQVQSASTAISRARRMAAIAWRWRGRCSTPVPGWTTSSPCRTTRKRLPKRRSPARPIRLSSFSLPPTS
jgi:hypothetical protein